MADTKRAAAHRRPGPERGVAAYRQTPERGKLYFTRTIYKFPDRLVGGSDSAFVSSSTAAELKLNRNPAIDVAADCLAAPRRNFEADSAAPWQRTPPLDHVQVAAMRPAWHES